MKQYWICFVISSGVLIGCSEDYMVESKLYDCNVAGFSEQNYDLNSKLAGIKADLQEQQILKTPNAEGFMDLLVEMSQGQWNDPPISEKTKVDLSEFLASDKNYYCSLESMGLDSAQFKTSRFYSIIQAFSSDFVTKNGESQTFGGVEFAQFYADQLSVKDMENPLYQMTVIWCFAHHFVGDQDAMAMEN